MTSFDHRHGQHVEIDGARIYCECRGNPDGPALVLLHGGFGSIETFEAIAAELGRVYRLIGIDSRGQGRSTLGRLPLTYRRIECDVVSVLDRLGVERCSVVGHSDGGIAGLRLAASHPARIDKLVTIGANWTLAADDPLYARYAAVTASQWRRRFPESVERYRALNPSPDFEALAAAIVAMWLDLGADGYPGERIRDIRSDLLVVRGDEDPLVSRRHALDMADRVEGARLANLPFAGHSPHEEKPAWVLALLERFLEG